MRGDGGEPVAQIKQNVALDDEEGGVITNGYVDTRDDAVLGGPLEKNVDFREPYLLFANTEKWGITVFEVRRDRTRVYDCSGFECDHPMLDGSLVWAVANEYHIEIVFEANGREYVVNVLKDASPIFIDVGPRKPLEMCLVRKGFTTMPNDDAYIPA